MKILFLFCVFISVAVCTPLPPVKKSAECIFCETTINSILTYLNGSSAEKDIEQAINVFCSVLPSALRTKCESFAKTVANFLHLLPKLAQGQDYDGFALCSMYNYCTVECCLTDKPEQVHLSFTDFKTEMSVTWTTRHREESNVEYGLSETMLNHTVTGKSHTYTDGGWSGWIHIAKMTGLKPGTKYYYRVGSKNGYSQVFNFWTERTYESQEPTRVIVYGDMGADEEANQVISRVQNLVHQHKIDFVIHNGDISYADGFQQRWDIFMRKIEKVAAYTPYMVTPGNHEIGVIGLLNTTLGYPHRFSLPGEYSTGPDLENMYYSFNYHNVHFIAIDTESILDTPLITDQQLAWLENDLKTLDRKKYPWVVVYGHRPLYCSNKDKADCGEGKGIFSVYLRNRLEPVFQKYKVDLVFMAHKHDYERMWPVYQSSPVFSYDNPNKPTYVLSGAGGNREGTYGFPEIRASWSAKAISKWGFGILTVYNSTTLTWEFITAHDNQVADTFTLQVNH